MSRTRATKRRIRKSSKTRRRKQEQKGAGDPILPEDILFQDDDVCILKPDVKKGVLIFTDYKQPPGIPSVCEGGLKTGEQLHREGVDFGRTKIHPYIFFRAPYLSNPVDYTSIDTEIASSFGEKESARTSRAWIRVDPMRTYVYSSEIRAVRPDSIHQSRKTMDKYLQIISEDAIAIAKIPPGQIPVYSLITSRMEAAVPYSGRQPTYPLNTIPINRNSEVLVRIPHLTPNYFVKCS